MSAEEDRRSIAEKIGGIRLGRGKNILISVGNQRFRLFLQEEDIPLAEEKEGEEELK